jgi:hypothetical protein
LAGKPEQKKPFGRPWHRWEDNIKMYHKEIGWDGVDWIYLAQDGEWWQTCEHGNEPLGSIKDKKFHEISAS